jgi:hypothetical protein
LCRAGARPSRSSDIETGGQLDPGALGARPVDELRRRRELGRRRQPQREAEARGGLDEALRNVVAVAGPGDDLAGDRAAMLLESHHVGHDLAGMRDIGQAVDDGHRRVLGQLADLTDVVGAQHDRVDVARQHAGGVLGRLAAAHLHVLRGQHDGVAAHLADPDLEGDAGAGRGLLEDQRDGPAVERTPRDAAALRLAAELEHAPQRRGVMVHDLEEMPRRRARLAHGEGVSQGCAARRPRGKAA